MSKNTEKKSSFDVVIVEDHNDALEPIYKEIGRRKLNFTNLTLLHFDSHPDLGIPEKFPADSIFDKNLLFEQTGIESWILPAVFAGHITTIVWVKPKWAHQIDCGSFEINIGKDPITGLIRLDSREAYFLSESLYLPKSSMTQTRAFLLYVCDFDSICDDTKLTEILNRVKPNELILDIDLDFFSTMDPFKRMFSGADSKYELFKSIYENKLDLSKDDPEFDRKYENYVKEKQKRLDEIYSGLKSEEISKDSNLSRFKEVISSRSLDLEILHSFGSGLDDRSLPDHVSDESEIKEMISKFSSFLTRYFRGGDISAVSPSIVTIARSSLDEYCPPQQVDFIQELTLDSIKSCWKELINSIKLNY